MTNISEKDYDFLIKILILGDSSVGKTLMIQKLKNSNLDGNTIATLGIDFQFHTIIVLNKRVKLQIFDTAGQEKYKNIATSYYRGVNCIIICFDVTSEDSYNHIKDWLNGVEHFAKKNVMKVLVGNKIDLDDERKISTITANDFADSCNIKYYETSALKNIGVKELFENISETYMKNNPEKFVNNNTNNNNNNDIFKLDENSNTKKKNKSC